jgi:geranylgeranyl diphosphate synthase type I
MGAGGGSAILEEYRSIIDGALRRKLAAARTLPVESRHALKHALGTGGKRIRQTITLLACQSVGGTVQDALDAAVAIEFLHCASLVLDDVIDEDDLRRGVRAVHSEFGTDLAIMVATLLTTRALRLVMHEADLIRTLISALDELSVGEILDIRSGKADVTSYLSVAEKKTGALFRLAAEMGGHMGSATPAHRKALGAFGQNFGIAFQLQDDVLDALGDQNLSGDIFASRSNICTGRASIVSVLLTEKLGITLQQLPGRVTAEGLAFADELINEAVREAQRWSASYVSKAENALKALPQSAPRQQLQSVLDFAATRQA